MRYTMGLWLADVSAGSALLAVLLTSVSAFHGVHAAGSVVGDGDGSRSLPPALSADERCPSEALQAGSTPLSVKKLTKSEGRQFGRSN